MLSIFGQESSADGILVEPDNSQPRQPQDHALVDCPAEVDIEGNQLGYYTLIYHSESAPLCCGSKTQRFQAHLLKIWPQDSLIENCQIFSIKESLKPTSMDFLQESLVWSSLEPTLLLRLFHSTNTYQVPTVCQALILQL